MTFIVYLQLHTDVIVKPIAASFEIEAEDTKSAKELADKILDKLKLKTDSVKMADKGSGFFV